MNNYQELFVRLEPSPRELLEMRLKSYAELWDWRDERECYDWEMYTGLLETDIEAEIRNIWLPIFHKSDFLWMSLDLLMRSYEGEIIEDFCKFYLIVLERINEGK